MATSFIESFSEDTQDKLTKAMLECSMLFLLNRNVTLNQGRKDMFLQSVFAITCSDNREWTAQDVHDVFHDKFTKEYAPDVIKKAMQKLTKEGFLIPKGNGVVPHEKIAEKMREDDRNIGERTEMVFDAVIENTERQLTEGLSKEECAQMKENLKDAFNLYVRMYGFESFVNKNVQASTDIVEDDFWDEKKLADEILAVAENPALRKTLQSNVKHEYRKISWNQVAKKCLKIYNRNIKHKRFN